MAIKTRRCSCHHRNWLGCPTRSSADVVDKQHLRPEDVTVIMRCLLSRSISVCDTLRLTSNRVARHDSESAVLVHQRGEPVQCARGCRCDYWRWHRYIQRHWSYLEGQLTIPRTWTHDGEGSGRKWRGKGLHCRQTRRQAARSSPVQSGVSKRTIRLQLIASDARFAESSYR